MRLKNSLELDNAICAAYAPATGLRILIQFTDFSNQSRIPRNRRNIQTLI